MQVTHVGRSDTQGTPWSNSLNECAGVTKVALALFLLRRNKESIKHSESDGRYSESIYQYSESNFQYSKSICRYSESIRDTDVTQVTPVFVAVMSECLVYLDV